MKVAYRLRFRPLYASLLVLVLTAVAFAQTSEAPAPKEELKDWAFYESVILPVKADQSKYAGIILTPSVFDKAASITGQSASNYPGKRFDDSYEKKMPVYPDDDQMPRVAGESAYLRDLRLYDAGKEIPFKLRIRRAQKDEVELTIHRFNDARTLAGDAETIIELMPDRPAYNSIEIELSGKSYHREVTIEGSNVSNDLKSWNLIRKRYLTQYDTNKGPILDNKIDLSSQEFKFLRVRVSPDASYREEKDKPEIKRVTVRRLVNVPGKDVTVEGQLGERQPTRLDGGPYASAWFITFGEGEKGELTPCEQILVDCDSPNFERTYHVEIVDPENQKGFLKSGQWTRTYGQPKAPLEIKELDSYRGTGDVMARRLRLTITDDNVDGYLPIKRVRAVSAAREVVFLRPSSSTSEPKLYFGNPKAIPPSYDFAKTLPAVLDSTPVQATLGPLTNNPEYVPPPLPLSERMPWLVYAVLAVASLVLVSILGLLAKEAITRADQAKPPPGDYTVAGTTEANLG